MLSVPVGTRAVAQSDNFQAWLGRRGAVNNINSSAISTEIS